MYTQKCETSRPAAPEISLGVTIQMKTGVSIEGRKIRIYAAKQHISILLLD